MGFIASTVLRYGKLWGRGHETFSSEFRRVISVKGKRDNATTYLQGLVTCDLRSDPIPPRDTAVDNAQPKAADAKENDEPPLPEVKFSPNLRSACFLDQRGRVLTDALLWSRPFDDNDFSIDNDEEEYLIDVPGDSADQLLEHLKQYKLRRSKVRIEDVSDKHTVHAVYGTLNAEGSPPGYLCSMDPRHPSIGMRIISGFPSSQEDTDTTSGNTHEERKTNLSNMMKYAFPTSKGTYSVIRKLSGIAEGAEIRGKTALETNQEFLNAVSFHKGW